MIHSDRAAQRQRLLRNRRPGRAEGDHHPIRLEAGRRQFSVQIIDDSGSPAVNERPIGRGDDNPHARLPSIVAALGCDPLARDGRMANGLFLPLRQRRKAVVNQWNDKRDANGEECGIISSRGSQDILRPRNWASSLRAKAPPGWPGTHPSSSPGNGKPSPPRPGAERAAADTAGPRTRRLAHPKEIAPFPRLVRTRVHRGEAARKDRVGKRRPHRSAPRFAPRQSARWRRRPGRRRHFQALWLGRSSQQHFEYPCHEILIRLRPKWLEILP